jgi:hypothetical protein
MLFMDEPLMPDKGMGAELFLLLFQSFQDYRHYAVWIRDFMEQNAFVRACGLDVYIPIIKECGDNALYFSGYILNPYDFLLDD